MYRASCACAGIEIRVNRVLDRITCHCPICQRTSGAASVAWGLVDQAEVVGSTVAWRAPDGVRDRCATCGTTVRFVGTTTRVPLALFDDAATLPPRAHVSVETQLAWHKPWDGRARVEGAEVPPATLTGWRATRDPSITRNAAVTLRAIDGDNRMAVIALQVAGPQLRYVAPNVMSLLEAELNEAPIFLRAIYADEVVVGLVLLDFPSEDELGLPLSGQPFVWRYMIDELYQGFGFGRRAMALVIEAMTAQGYARMFVGAVPGVHSPLPFYEARGFRDTGQRDEGEHILRLDLVG